MGRVKEAFLASHDGEAGERGATRQDGEHPPGARARGVLPSAERSGLCTPAPAWKLEEGVGEAGPSRSHDGAGHSRERSRPHHRGGGSLVFPVAAPSGAGVSARKLGADLWGIQELPVARMSRRGARGRHHREEQLGDLSPLGPHEPAHHASDLRRHVAASVNQHRRSTDRNAHALQPVSPASYNSSMEVAACHQAITPTSSLDLKGRPEYSLKTSMELLRVLNRIWSLEEQHTSSMSVAKALKLELEHAQGRIQELLQEKQSGRHEIDVLTKQIMEDKLVRKSREQQRIKAAVESVRDELEDERRLRRHSENLHRKLAKELAEVKSAFLKAVKDFEKERNAHNLLEDLCDEFAKGVRQYEREVRELKQKAEKGSNHRCDRMVLHISEAWLDERLQMKLAEARGDLSEKNKIIDRLTCEIETFLQARQINNSNDDILIQHAIKDSCLHRHSLESIRLNGALSAPQEAEDEDSLASDSHCFELNMTANATGRPDILKRNALRGIEKLEARKSNATKKIMGSSDRFKYQSSSSSQLRLDGHAQSHNRAKLQFTNGVQRVHRRNTSEGGKDPNHVDAVVPQKSEDDESLENIHGMKIKQDSTHGSNNIMENSVSEMEFGRAYNVHAGDDHKDNSCDACSWPHSSLAVGRNSASGDCHSLSCPAQQWSHHDASDAEISECSSRLPQGVKENSLKAKLLEARLEGRHARLKTSRASSFGV